MNGNIILCGMPGVGKTSAGRILASQMSWQFIDTDIALEVYYERMSGNALSCRQIYQTIGEMSFRLLENQILTQFLLYKDCIIAVGGGTLNHLDNIHLLKQIGKIIYLKNDCNVIYNRLLQSNAIPAYLDPENPYVSFKQLAQQREPIYESAADCIIDSENLSPSEVTVSLQELIGRIPICALSPHSRLSI